MTHEQINTAIAEACGWTRIRKTAFGIIGNTTDHDMSPMSDDYLAPRPTPDYANDLNAMHEAERSNEMHFDQRWAEAMVEIAHRDSATDIDQTDGWDWVLLVARLTPTQRAEAFLRAIGKWEEEVRP